MTGLWAQRWHPLRREWVIVAAHRQDRPWRGEVLPPPSLAPLPAHDPDCAFCPGNQRLGGARNPAYPGVYVFDNDRPCVGPDAPLDLPPPPGIYRQEPARGRARVVCFAPRHDLSLAELGVPAIDAVLACWQQQSEELAALPGVRHVLVFENRGAAVGVSNPHPHGQIYATSCVFPTIAREAEACRDHLAARGVPLWQEIVATEAQDGRRMLYAGPSAVAFVPWFARYAYEAFVGPRRAVPTLAGLDAAERRDLAVALHAVLVAYDNLWRQPFPYVLAVHQAPRDGQDHRGFGCHLELHPPLRKPGLLKYLAGPEVGGGGFLADTDPDVTAAELRAGGGVHYKQMASAPPR